MSSPLRTVKAIFDQAVEVETPTERAQYLDQACAGDAELRQRVEDLLLAYTQAGSFLEKPIAELLPTGEASPGPELVAETLAMTYPPGTVIGPYKLLEQIGEGGMGTVWMAQQTKPVKRLLALKVIKPGMDSRQVIARFEAERQALALMDHPNIARVFDAGTTECGRPYFVMELVKGVPLTEFCDQNRLTPRERLELFIPVCQAIQHAHQKGIIHRDVKPSNVLVASYDGRPVPKVIDFGVAKATGPQLTDNTLVTGFGSVVGTLEYMSPEQAELNQLDIDTRSDIYSLGVLLYELLTGTTPLDRKRLKEAAILEVLRLIREEEPPRPSQRLSTTQEMPSIAANRGLEPKRLSGLVRGDLDWIVMKALEKDRNRRYETANGLAVDLQRYLHDDPVQACPPSALYRFRKFARRNKGALVTALILTATLLVATGVSTYFAFKAADRADELRRGLDDLTAANRLLEYGRFALERERWDDADAAFSNAIARCPQYARPWETRADLYAHLGLWHLAASDLAQAVQLREPDTSWRWLLHALLRLDAGDIAGYRTVCSRMRQRFAGTREVEDVLRLIRASMQLPDPQADPAALAEMARSIAECNPGVAYFKYVWGLAELRAGHYGLAAETLRRSYEGDLTWGQRALNLPMLALAYHRLGQKENAEKALAQAAAAIDHWIETRYRGVGNDRLWAIHQSAQPAWPLGLEDWLEIRARYREAYRAIHGTAPSDDFRLQVLRARALAGLRRREAADVTYSAVLLRRPDDAQIRLETYRNRAYLAGERGRWAESAMEFSRAVALRPNNVRLWSFQVTTELAAGNVDAYRRGCRTMVERFDRTTDPYEAHHVVATCMLRGDSLAQMSDLIPLARVAARLHHGNSRTLGAALYRTGRYAEALACLEKSARQIRPNPADLCFAAMAQQRLGRTSEAQCALAQAIAWIEEADRRKRENGRGPGPAWGGLLDRVEFSLMVSEAKRVLRGD